MTFQADCQSLSCMPAFRGVDPAKLRILALAADRISVRPGDPLVQAGRPPEHVYILLSAKVDIVREDAERSIRLAQLGAGEILGETSALAGIPHAQSAVASTRGEALRIDVRAFLEILEQVPALTMAILKSMSGRLEATNTRLFDASRR